MVITRASHSFIATVAEVSVRVQSEIHSEVKKVLDVEIKEVAFGGVDIYQLLSKDVKSFLKEEAVRTFEMDIEAENMERKRKTKRYG
jgi:hypothetical protein